MSNSISWHPKYIIKRNGKKQEWDPSKITNAIFKALKANNINDYALAQYLTKKVHENLPKDQDTIHLEVVQDVVEKTLAKEGYFDIAKSYIVYRERRKIMRENSVEVPKLVEEYLDMKDWRVNENSNMDYNYGGFVLHLASSVQARYALDLYGKEIANAHKYGYFHIHDLGFGLTAYCAGWSLRDLLIKGFKARNRLHSKPAKHFSSALLQMVNFLGCLQNEWAGAQAFNNVDTLLAPFIRFDKLSYKEVKQNIQQFVYNLNVTSRWGSQTPFTNITLDFTCPEHMKHEAVIYGGKLIDATYGEFEKEIQMFNKAFLEVMLEGDALGRVFTFPIPTYNITKDFPWDSENGELLLEVTKKYGIPYFQNFINSDMDPTDIRAMCCRLQMDLRELRKKTGGLFGSGDNTGSIGVVTLNLPKLAYLSKGNKEKFFELIKYYTDLACTSLEIKRKVITNQLEKGLFPYTQEYLGEVKYNHHFSTVGVVGGHEACINLLGKGIETEEGKQLMIETLNYIKNILQDWQEKTGTLFNLEATPAEGASYRLAKIDKQLYPDIYTSGEKEPFYTNSTTLPVDLTDDIFFHIEHQKDLQPIYTSGTVFHIYVGEDNKQIDIDALKKLLVYIMSETKIPYISFTPTYSICPNHGYIYGEHFKCPKCGSECEVFTRVVGYFRAMQQYNKGKKEEFRIRKYIKVSK